LTSLNLQNAQMSREVGFALGRLTQLRSLHVPQLSVDDEILASFGSLKNLRELTLHVNLITNKGLATLADMRSLKVVDLTETEVSNRGMEALRNARPGMRVLPEHAKSMVGFFIGRGDVEGMRKLLDVDPEAVNENLHGGTGADYALQFAAGARDLAMAKLLIERGAVIDAQNSLGSTALIYACITDRFNPVIPLLIEHGADINHGVKSGYTPLDLAVSGHNVDLLKLLFAHGVDPDSFHEKALRPETHYDDLIRMIRDYAANRIKLRR